MQTVDFPICAFYLDLYTYYKARGECNVILTVRDDAEKWFKSVDSTIHEVEQLLCNSFVRILILVAGTDFVGMRNLSFGGLIFDQRRGAGFDDFWSDKQAVMKKYEDWIASVKRHIPAEDLLVFNVKQGYGPFCAFLGVDEVDDDFPHANDTNKIRGVIDKMKSFIVICRCVTVGLSAISIYSLYRMYRK